MQTRHIKLFCIELTMQNELLTTILDTYNRLISDIKELKRLVKNEPTAPRHQCLEETPAHNCEKALPSNEPLYPEVPEMKKDTTKKQVAITNVSEIIGLFNIIESEVNEAFS